MANKQKDVKYIELWNQCTTLNGLKTINRRLLNELSYPWIYWPSGFDITYKYFINEHFYTAYYWALHKYVLKGNCGDTVIWPEEILKKAQERNRG